MPTPADLTVMQRADNAAAALKGAAFAYGAGASGALVALEAAALAFYTTADAAMRLRGIRPFVADAPAEPAPFAGCACADGDPCRHDTRGPPVAVRVVQGHPCTTDGCTCTYGHRPKHLCEKCGHYTPAPVRGLR